MFLFLWFFYVRIFILVNQRVNESIYSTTAGQPTLSENGTKILTLNPYYTYELNVTTNNDYREYLLSRPGLSRDTRAQEGARHT